MKKLLRDYLLALRYFTRIPVTGTLAGWAASADEPADPSAAHFPGVGVLIGMAACVAFSIVSLLLPEAAPATPLAAAVACTIVTALLTGASHESGLTAFARGFGTITLVLALALKISLLAVIASQSPAGVLAALLAGHAVARFWPLVLAHTLPYLPQADVAAPRPLVARIDRRALHIAAAWCVVPLLLMAAAGRLPGMLLALIASGLALWVVRRLLQRRLQGFAGDAFDATQQVCEIAFYLGAAIGIGGGR